MFSGKTENNFINKIFKRTLQSIYETEDATFENLVERDESQSIHKNENTHIANWNCQTNTSYSPTNYDKQKERREVFCKKKVFLEISQNLQENTCARVSILK